MHAHPASVHFPIAYLFLGGALRICLALQPGLLQTYLGVKDENIAIAARYLKAAGLLSAIPTALTGAIDVIKFARKQAMFHPGSYRLTQKADVIALHAATAMTALICTASLWYYQRIGTKNMPWDFMLELFNVGLLMYAAKIGGALAFDYGMGFSNGNAASKQKKK